MRKIKFRGISKETGEKVFGYYLKSGDDDQIFDGEYFHSVKPESVAQLIGLDSECAEVYEGDWLVEKSGINWRVGREFSHWRESTLKKINFA